MAKQKSKETGLPVIIALVFFILTTIGLGVFVYVLYSDQEKMAADVEKSKSDLKNARQGETEAKQVADEKAGYDAFVLQVKGAVTEYNAQRDNFKTEAGKFAPGLTNKMNALDAAANTRLGTYQANENTTRKKI